MKEKNWIEKIKQGMELIKQGCSENSDWTACCKCPFYEYCDTKYPYYDDGTKSETPEDCF